MGDSQEERNIVRAMYASASAAAKDQALRISVASGEEDIFIDMEMVNERIDMLREKESIGMELQGLLDRARKADVQYLHIF